MPSIQELVSESLFGFRSSERIGAKQLGWLLVPGFEWRRLNTPEKKRLYVKDKLAKEGVRLKYPSLPSEQAAGM